MFTVRGRRPMADRRFRARDSRMTVAEVVLCGSRVPVSFIKHPFIFGLFNTPRHSYASSKCTQNGRLAAKAIIAVRVSLLRACGREGMPPFSRNETHSQMGSAEPHSQSKASWTAYLASKIISPLKRTLSTFLSTPPRAKNFLERGWLVSPDSRLAGLPVHAF